MRDIDAQRASAAKDASDLFARTKDELVRRDLETQRKDARIDVLERDLDTWIDRARGWQRRAHAVVHKLNNVRQAFNAGRVRAGLREIPWSNETLPPMEEISASNETYFNRDPSGSWVDPDAST